jgi:glycosyltransferase involved in cell wall biosynthesis
MLASNPPPLVSIVTPSYNQASFLEHSIRSVLLQDYPRVEYMVVDGGSTDGSLKIIDAYQDYLAWWVSEPDQGQAQAINKGLKRAKGEIVAWLNSDDLYLPGAISAVVKEFQNHRQISLVFGNAISIDENGRPFNDQVFGERKLDDFMAFNIICQPAVFIRRCFLERVGWLDESYHYLLDHHLWLRIVQEGPAFFLPESLACARYHSGAKNVAQAADFGREAYRVLDWMQNQADLALRLKRQLRRVWAGAHRFNARYLLDGGLAGPALVSYLRALRAHPPTALKEWRRMIYSLFSLGGFGWLGESYTRWQRRRYASTSRHKNLENVQKIYSEMQILRQVEDHEHI